MQLRAGLDHRKIGYQRAKLGPMLDAAQQIAIGWVRLKNDRCALLFAVVHQAYINIVSCIIGEIFTLEWCLVSIRENGFRRLELN